MAVLDHRPSVLEVLQRRATDRGASARTGLDFRPARTIDEVLSAWRLVHDAYVRSGLIEPNPHGVHLTPRAIHPETIVGVGMLEETVSATISGYVDVDAGPGLPLDEVYPELLGRLREEGRVLMEVGLLADRRADLGRSLDATLALMKQAFFHGIHRGATDLVIGVHPHHVRFYERLFAFEVFGEESTCPMVNDAPVVGLRLDLAPKLMLEPLPRGLRYFVDCPVEREEFAGRFVPTPEAIRGTPIEAFLADREAERRRASA